jgi:hypothetical protein
MLHDSRLTMYLVELRTKILTRDGASYIYLIRPEPFASESLR